MPYIIKNGLTYTGNLMPITQAQYEALSEAEKNNGIAYFIVDSDAVLDASDVGLGEGNVEDLAGSVATIESSPAVANHAVGDFILWNGQLYSVIDAIRVGQTLTVGSNITARSVGSELTSLKSGLNNQFREVSVSFNDSTISANAAFEISKTINVPSGYHPLCLRGWNFSRLNGLTVTRVTVSGSSVTVGGYNASSTTTLNGSATVLCVNNY